MTRLNFDSKDKKPDLDPYVAVDVDEVSHDDILEDKHCGAEDRPFYFVGSRAAAAAFLMRIWIQHKYR